MFSTLESTWDRSARRGWTTLASFGLQAMAVSLLLLVPLVWVQGPPRLQWIDRGTVPAPRGVRVPEQPLEHVTRALFSNVSGGHVLAPTYIPRHVVVVDDAGMLPLAIGDVSREGVDSAGPRDGVPFSIGNALPTLITRTPPAPPRPIITSKWAEGNLIYRVQPVYPPLAIQARIQGMVQLRAIISKAGTIENLVAVSGHPMLVPAAVNAVRQWRYRPYMLNGEPIEVETEVTVNFVIGGS